MVKTNSSLLVLQGKNTMNENRQKTNGSYAANRMANITPPPPLRGLSTDKIERRVTDGVTPFQKSEATAPPIIIDIGQSRLRVEDGEYNACIGGVYDLGTVLGYQEKPTHKIGLTYIVQTQDGPAEVSDVVTATLYRSKLRDVVRAAWGTVPAGASRELNRLAGCGLKIYVRTKISRRGSQYTVVDDVGRLADGEAAPTIEKPEVWNRAHGTRPPAMMPYWIRNKMQEWAEEQIFSESAQSDAEIVAKSRGEVSNPVDSGIGLQTDVDDGGADEDGPSIVEYGQYIDDLNKEAVAAGWGVK